MTQQELEKIIEDHNHWLNKDCDGWGRMMADLTGADIRGADLRWTNLKGAKLMGADLSRADLRWTNLKGAKLMGADLSRADLSGANLSEANLTGTNLRGADLTNVDLRGADLNRSDIRRSDLSGVDLSWADLSNADLSMTDLSGAKIIKACLVGAKLNLADLGGANIIDSKLARADLTNVKNFPINPYACPDSGSFIGYKKAGLLIIELEIPEDARRSCATGKKCRCDKAKVLSITNLNGINRAVTAVSSDYDSNFIYKLGEVVSEPAFNTSRWDECAPGIHFFMNRDDAVNYS